LHKPVILAIWPPDGSFVWISYRQWYQRQFGVECALNVIPISPGRERWF